LNQPTSENSLNATKNQASFPSSEKVKEVWNKKSSHTLPNFRSKYYNASHVSHPEEYIPKSNFQYKSKQKADITFLEFNKAYANYEEELKKSGLILNQTMRIYIGKIKVSDGKDTISIIDLSTLTGDKWLNDKIMESYIILSIEKTSWKNKMVLYSAHFTSKIIATGELNRNKKKGKLSVFLMNRSSHWMLTIIDVQNKEFVFFDPLQSKDIYKKMFESAFLKEGESFTSLDFKYKRQVDSNNCGPICLEFIDFIVNALDTEELHPLQILHSDFKNDDTIIDNLSSLESSRRKRSEIFGLIVDNIDNSLNNLCRICCLADILEKTDWIGCDKNANHWFHSICFLGIYKEEPKGRFTCVLCKIIYN
jgi:hypothetical protein